MSGNAYGWVWDHSPYKGATLLVHLAIGDVVNDMHDYEFWMTVGKVGTKARLGRNAVIGALATLVADGYLEVLAEGGGRGNPTRYRFLRPSQQTARSEDGLETARSKRETARSGTETARSTCSTHTSNEKELKELDPTAVAVDGQLEGMPPTKQSKKESDPIVGEAHAIATKVMKRVPRPVQPFFHVRAVAEACLRAEWPAAEVEALMMDPTVPLTANALDVARARRHEQNGKNETGAEQLARLRAEGKL